MSVEWLGNERRRAARKTLNETVLLSLPGEVTVTPCTVRDLTVLGVGIDLQHVAPLPTQFELSFDDFRTRFVCQLVWRQADRAGISFVH